MKFAALMLLLFAATSQAAPKKPAPLPAAITTSPAAAHVRSRPAIAGDQVENAKLTDYSGKTVELKDVLKDKYTVVVYSNPEDLAHARQVGYFDILNTPLTKLGYQFVFVCATKDMTIPAEATTGSDVTMLIDEGKRSFQDMGLSDVVGKSAATRSGVFLVDPKLKILFGFSSSSRSVPLSSEVLILAARVYRDYSKKELGLDK